MNETGYQEREPTHVVGVGASAGGLEALERLFKQIPTRTGMAFVVVQHLSPDFKSLMDELLARWTQMPIHRVDEGMEVEANSIYLIPPKMEISIVGKQLHLWAKNPGDGLSLPIDVFFESLAKAWGPRSVGVVLSGTGSDGSRGIRDIHEAGGLVLSQSVETAKFDGMPRSAEKTGVVDLVLSPEEIANTLDRYSCFPVGDKSQLLDKPVLVDEGSMNRLLRLLREECGIDFAFYKSGTVMRRVERRVLLSQSYDFDTYVDRVADDRDELNLLYKDLLIGVTSFFRDPNAFDLVQRNVLPELLKQLNPGDQFRVWVSGCATGEEPYSLAISLLEQLEELQLQLDVKIFATDVHRASLDFASAGIYADSSLANLSPERKRRFFVRTARGYQLIPEIRQMIVFAPHNVIADAPFTKLDFVSCRNMLIYFQGDVQARVLSLFHFSLKKHGVLFLGPSETLGELASEFETVDSHWKLYRKKRDVRLPRELQLPISGDRPATTVRLPSIKAFSPLGDRVLADAYDHLLDRYMPAGVLLDDQRQIVHVFGDAVKYVQLRPGRPTQDSLDWFLPSLRSPAAGAILRAIRELEPVHFTGLQVNDEADSPQIRLGVQPIIGKDGDLTHLMVTFEPVETRLPPPSQELDASDVSSDRITVLESELRVMRENLQATIEELETSNEELQATNEELVASNEELQSTNEELHSVNEELYTVNAEYQKKITELTELSDDMNHLFENLDAGLLFLDSDLAVRKFTPSIAKIFNLLPQDIGRSFDSFTHKLNRQSLCDDIREVIKNRATFEKEVRNNKGEWFLMRIQPYRSRGRIDGAVMEIFDITQVKRTRSQLRCEIHRLREVLDQTETRICAKDLEGRYLHASASYAAAMNMTPEMLIGKEDHQLIAQPIADMIQAAALRAVSSGDQVNLEEPICVSGGNRFTGTVFPIRDETGRIESVGTYLTTAGRNTDPSG